MASDDGWKGLHPLSLAVNLVPRTWATLRGAWPLLLALVYGRATGQGLFDLSLVLLFFGLAIGNTVVHFATLRYRVIDGRLEIRSGLLNRQVRVIAADRVQNLEMVRNVFHRVSGLVEVRIETASGTEVEGLLSALTVEDAQAMIEALQAARGEAATAAEPEPAQIVAENGPVELLWYGATGLRLGGVAVLVGFAYEAWIAWNPPTDPEALGANPARNPTFTGLFVIAALTGAWLLGVGTALVRHHGFRLARIGRALVAEQGLFTRRRNELRLGKVQLVTVVEPWLRRLAGFASVWVETAAAREGGDGTQRSEAAVPYVPRDQLARVIDAALPLDQLDPNALVLRPPHPFAWRRAVLRAVARVVVPTVFGWLLFGPWSLLLLVLLPPAVTFALLDVRQQGWLVTDRLVVSRRGFLDRRTALLARDKLQSAIVVQDPFMRRRGVGVLQLRVAGSRVVLPMLAHAEAVELMRTLVRR